MTGIPFQLLFRGLVAIAALTGIAASAPAFAKDSGGEKPMCEIAGPQSPRDVTATAGNNNPPKFSLAPEAEDMQLCNIHFHKNAEHKAKGYPHLVGEGDQRGYACSAEKSGHETINKNNAHATPTGGGCEGIAPGDTIEVHWVFTSCQAAKPGKGLASCVPAGCSKPQLRVEARTFRLNNDAPNDFMKLTALKDNNLVTLLPAADRVQYAGSTTGPSYNNKQCSPFLVSWSVDQTCHSLDIASVNKWCASNNAFDEHHAHGVRKLVTDLRFLSATK